MGQLKERNHYYYKLLPQVPSMSLLNCLYFSGMMSPFGTSWTAITELVSSHIDY